MEFEWLSLLYALFYFIALLRLAIKDNIGRWYTYFFPVLAYFELAGFTALMALLLTLVLGVLIAFLPVWGFFISLFVYFFANMRISIRHGRGFLAALMLSLPVIQLFTLWSLGNDFSASTNQISQTDKQKILTFIRDQVQQNRSKNEIRKLVMKQGVRLTDFKTCYRAATGKDF